MLFIQLTFFFLYILEVINGSKSVVERTVETLFADRSQIKHSGACQIPNSTARQLKICRKDPGLHIVLSNAKSQAIEACEQSFQYDRWNCSLIYNRNTKKSIFNKIYRETAFVHALISASISHTVAKGCASGDLYRCSCLRRKSIKTKQWKESGCGDDFKYGKRLVKNFLDLKNTPADQVSMILKEDILIGINSIGEHLKEVCKCHGFSGSCTTKTCWKRLGPFNSAMGLLKKHYHHAVRRKLLNVTITEETHPTVKRKKENDKLLYIHRTPNLCKTTKGRVCKDRNNCATLCCGRGFTVSKKSISKRCRCRMESCCFVTCDTCIEDVDVFQCK